MQLSLSLLGFRSDFTAGSLLKQTPLAYGVTTSCRLSNSGWVFTQSLLYGYCHLALSAVVSLYRSLVEIPSFQRSLKGRD